MEAPGYEGLISSIKELLSLPVDETQPYKQWYAAADLLKSEEEKLNATAGEAKPLESMAWLQAQRGLILLETDLRHDGEACILNALQCLEAIADMSTSTLCLLAAPSAPSSSQGDQAPEADIQAADQQSFATDPASSISQSSCEAYKAVTVLQRCYNALGALWSERSDLEAALEWLTKAECLYHEQHRRALQRNWPQEESSGSTGAAGAAVASPAAAVADNTAGGAVPNEPASTEVLEAGYTLTVFSLAQVYGHAGSKEKSALYCAATLQRQLASGEVQLSEWVQNCLQLSTYYVNSSAFAIGQYLLEAVQRVSQMEAERKAQSADVPAEASGSEKCVAWQSALDDDVAANVNLAWGKLYLYRLVASLAYMQQSDKDCSATSSLPFSTPQHFPDLLRFPSLAKQLPSPEELPWGVDALATSFEAARDLFNAAIPRFNVALEYYKLDGWVTEHVTTQMEVSNLYRLLATFEPDPKRAAAMHKLRVARLEHIVGALNPQHYLGLTRSIDLETANAWRDHVDALTTKQDAKAPNKTSKAIAAGATAATRSYTNFINSFRKDGTGELPDRIDKDNEHFFLMAAFNLGRVLHRCALKVDQGTSNSDLDVMVQAYKHLHWIADYVKRHKIEKMKQEASMAEQLASLIAEKIDLTKKMASMPNKT